jgi:cytoskeletal protein CcmA (bactofilin family)
MFGKKKTPSTPLVLTQEKFDTLIGRHAEFEGNLRLNESIRIDGRVLGHVHSASDQAVSVVIGPTGEVVGDLVAQRVIVAGKVSGNIHALDRVELHAGCFVQGDLKYASIAIEHGARVQGLLLQLDAADSTARPDKDAQEAIRRVQALGQSQGGNRP